MKTIEEVSAEMEKNPERYEMMRDLMNYMINYGIAIEKFRQAAQILKGDNKDRDGEDRNNKDRDDKDGDDEDRNGEDKDNKDRKDVDISSVVFWLVNEAARNLTNTSIEPLRLHATYILQQQCSLAISPEYIAGFYSSLARKARPIAQTALHVTSMLLDEDCGRSIFHIFQQGNFDTEYVVVKSTVDDRRIAVETGHHRQIPQEYIDSFVNGSWEE